MNLNDQLTPNDVKIVLKLLGIIQKGAGWKTIKSPFRDDHNPSFGINLETGAWKDHANGETGDLVTLTELILNKNSKEAIQWIKDQCDLSKQHTHQDDAEIGILNGNSFWMQEQREEINKSQNDLAKNPNHPLIKKVKDYDCLTFETLLSFNIGIINKWNQDWLAFPYKSGVQLYRRENGEKVIRALQGSKPGDSFFGLQQIVGKKLLFFAKSPRECMLLSQKFGGYADTIGLCTGEQGTVSNKQFKALTRQISRSNYSEIYVFLDCNTPKALATAKSFANTINDVTLKTEFNGKLKLVNIHQVTGGAFKDITDCIRNGMDSDLLSALLKDSEPLSTETDLPPSVDDFFAYAPENKFIFIPTRELWPASSVKQRVKSPDENMSVTSWLSRNRSVEQMTWVPGKGMLIKDRLFNDGGWTNTPGRTTFNLYQEPTIKPGIAKKATPWIQHIHRLYPDHADHLIHWFAHRVQKPGEKINHAIILGGPQGIGKDTILAPIKFAIGTCNFVDVNPIQLMGRFNGFIKSVILRVSEARDMGDVDRYKLYEHLKIYTASPPEVLRCDEKNRREYGVINICGVVITTNYKAGGIYLPPDDRRHYVAWSECTKDDFANEYWKKLWNWYNREGFRHIATYLQELDLTHFDPKAPPPKTDAFWEIVDAGRAPEDAELADALDKLDNPDAVTKEMVAEVANGDFYDWLRDRRNNRQIPHRFETAEYIRVRNDTAKDGLWKIGGKRVAVYAKKELSKRDRIKAAQNLHPLF